MFSDNPEFRRNLWLSATPTALAVTPALVGLVLLTVFYSAKDFDQFCQITTYLGIMALSVNLILVGARMATESIAGEVSARTWDSQRMTSLSPFQMTVGKLFGSTILCWYATAFIAAAVLLASMGRDIADRGVIIVINCVLVGLLVHSVCGVAVLSEMRRSPQGFGSRHSGLYLIIAVIVLFNFMPSSLNFLSSDSAGNPRNMASIKWFFWDFSLIGFQTLSYAIFAFWSVYGLYRNMRSELLLENGPFAWLFFLLTCMFYMAGFWAHPGQETAGSFMAGLLAAFLTAVFWTYIMALLEPKNIVEYKRLVEKLQAGDKKAFRDRVPLWAVSLATAAVACVAAAALMKPVASPEGYNSALNSSSFFGADLVFPISVFFFMARDVGIILFWHMKPNPKRPDLTISVTFLVAYAITPLMFSAGGQNDLVLGVFLPVFKGSAMIRLVPAMLQAAAIWHLVKKRFETFVLAREE